MRNLAKRAPFTSRRHWKAALSVIFVPVLLLLLAACTTTDPEAVPTPGELPTVQADLPAPPAVPAPITRDTAAHVVVDLTAVEQDQEIAPGVEYQTWTFNSTVPGPMVRVRVGDTVEIRLTNPASNTQAHNIDLHAVNGPGGGMEASMVNPGEAKAFTFKAKSAGLFTYHCAAGNVADHISNGMYGGILVEPATGMPSKVDHEYYVGQNEFYTTGATGETGHQDLDYDKMQAEQPTYVTFNGNTKALTGDNALQSSTRDKVRLFVVDGGPNLISSFHVIGEIFDRAWQYGSLEDDPMHGIQTMLVPPGGSAIAEFETEVPGDYKMVDHAISRVGLGAVGIIHVTGDDNPGTFKALGPITPAGGSDASPTPTAPPATTTPDAAETTTPGEAATIKIVMKDNFFEPDKFTVAAGQKVTLELQNAGKIPHNINFADAMGMYDDSAGSQLLGGGKSETFTWLAPAVPGQYNFQCDVHPQQMTGVVTVQ